MVERFEEPVVEAERYEFHEPQRYRFSANRREFAQTLGTGLLVIAVADEAHGQRRGGTARRDEPLSERFHLGADGIVTVLTGKVEVGQGSRTQITQATAEELGLPIDRIRLIMAEVPRCPDDGGTAGSRTTPSTIPRVRSAAAALRQRLLAYATERLGVPRDQVSFSDGVFRSAGRPPLTLAELANDEELDNSLSDGRPSDGVATVAVENWKVLGTSVRKVGGRDVVTGAAKYPSDIQRPGMLYGKVVRPIAFGATLRSVELARAQELDGVVAVRDGEFVGCAAATSWLATKAHDALVKTCQWDRLPQPSSDELYSYFKQTARKSDDRGSRQWGNRASAFADAAGKLECSYTVAYVQHAPMEPRAAVAEWNDGGLTVWTGSQQPARVHRELCDTFRLPTDRVRLIVPDTGGGFGGKHTGEAAVEAARLAKAAGRPVSLRWTREEEFTWAYFRPAGLIEIQAAVDASGQLATWDFSNYNSGGSAIETPYRVPHGRTRFVYCDAPLRQGSYRALASTANTFARESAMDELALLAKADPLTFRLQHLDDGRLKDVLQAAAAKFQWSKRRNATARNRGIGLACGTEKGSFVAACAEVEVVDGKTRVVEVCQAFECGAVQNPVNLRSQNAGALIMGLGAALHEAIEFSEGRIVNPRFSQYRVPRMSDVPKLDLVQLDRRDLPSVGAGETPIIAVAPAVANAVHHATGLRHRSMPLKL